ncbi:hypothetical protein [Hamadaea tsunoensis]|uniref:hypothetical protein n=1 Tax=Hamadaea tsunoensis TaxID=53368 RepID=UPI0004013582|nr:hypothetical protein [Hamadaea tsunoensis]
MGLTQAAAHALLKALPVAVAEGLTAAEVRAAETRFGFVFNPDHKTFLMAGLPTGNGWPDWRTPRGSLADRLSAPIEGVLFDVEENGFWAPAWGDRPRTTGRAVDVARRNLAQVPLLVPVFKHRYAPALPKPGLPVFSVMQTDVIVYGADLGTYLRREFGPAEPGGSDGAGGADGTAEAVRVPFWSDLAS